MMRQAALISIEPFLPSGTVDDEVNWTPAGLFAMKFFWPAIVVSVCDFWPLGASR